MKIEKTLRDAYQRQYELALLVQQRVRELRSAFDSHWHYTDRVKGEESFAQKIEAGLGRPDLSVDDFFACTIVVRNTTEIAGAAAAISEYCHIVERRPQDDAVTHSRPTDFQFDDLRLYVRLNEGYGGASPINTLLFEVQIKTFLKHAWGIATHDLTYKTDEVSWAKLRLASQIRAMLEHAELSIEQFAHLSHSPILAKANTEFDELSAIISFLNSRWEEAALPSDMQRLARSIQVASRSLGIGIDDVIKYVDADTAIDKGAKAYNLSPFNAVMQAVLNRHEIDPKKMRKSGRTPIMVSRTVELSIPLDAFAGSIIYFY